MSLELYKKHRPRTVEEVVGQNSAIAAVKKMLEQKRVPHSILFTGPSGCGKTTLARILRKHLKCSKMDYQEIDGADKNGIETIRQIRSRMYQAPLNGLSRIWVIDECHMLSTQAQNNFLKMLEDTPNHVYFFLATTDPGKLLRTIITRCTEVSLKPISNSAIENLLTSVCKKEGIQLSEEVADKIVSVSQGSARQALVVLNQIMGLNTEEEQLEAIAPERTKTAAIELFKLLINPKAKWADMAKVLRELQEEPEGIRRLILACSRNVLLKGGPSSSRAFVIIDSFKENYFNTGSAGLAASCYSVLFGSE